MNIATKEAERRVKELSQKIHGKVKYYSLQVDVLPHGIKYNAYLEQAPEPFGWSEVSLLDAVEQLEKKNERS